MRIRLTSPCLIAVSLLLVAPRNIRSQVATGVYTSGAFDSKGFDTVNLGNLNVHFEIPVFSKQGRGGMDFSYGLVYDSAVWTPSSVSGTLSWVPSTTWGWTADTNAITGFISYASSNHKCFDSPPGWWWSTKQSNFQYIDGAGATHNFSNGTAITSTVSDCSTYGSTDVEINATDGSGLVLLASLNDYQIRYPNGKVVTPPQNVVSGTASIVDTNGNQITTSSTGFTDTTGTTVITLSGSGSSSSPRVLTYPVYLSTGASTASVTIHYASYNVKTNFGCTGVAEYTASSISLVDYVQLADGQRYQFTYEPTPSNSGYVTGRPAQITMPGGGRILYSYSGGSNGIVCQDGGTATLTRAMLDDPAASSWSYTRTPGTIPSGATVATNSHTEVVDGLSNHATYDFVNDATDANLTPYVVSHSQYNGPASGTPLLAELTCYNTATTCVGESLTLPIGTATTTSTLDGSMVGKRVISYTSGGLFSSEVDYAYGGGSPGAQIHGSSVYYASLGNGIINRPHYTCTTGTSTSCEQFTEYGYDENSLTATSGLPQHVSVSGARGNLTSVQLWTGQQTPTVPVATYTYDDAGQAQRLTDDKGNSTTYAYDSGTDTFNFQTTAPSTGGISHITSAAYDIPSGILRSTADQNSNPTLYTYDNMLRVVATSVSASSAKSATYNLNSTTPYITSSVLHAGSAYISSTSHLDAYGRVASTEKADTPSNDLVAYAYDANGLLSKSSNPYRSGDTVYYTQFTYDALGRTKLVVDPDGSSQTSYAYTGNAVTSTDEASKKRKIFQDPLGRTIEVLEPDSSNNLTLETDYQYDQNLTLGYDSSITTYQTIINQKGGSTPSSDWRTRTFTYDMLGRVIAATTPEAGTINYAYMTGTSYCTSSVTQPCSRTDANGTVTTYTYDALSRLTGKTYSGTTIATNTSAVSYYYDQTSYNGLSISNGTGLRTGMSDGSGSTAWSYDGLGNIAAVRKTLNSVTKQANYSYNADSTVNSVQDFGGTTLSYSYNVAGRPTQVIDGSGNSYAASAAYYPSGQLYTVNHQLTPTGAPYVRTWQLNSMLQPSVISATLNGSTIQSLSYSYGATGSNNGNIVSIVNGMDSSRSQTYTYDNLNRIQSGNDASHWGETYTYDNWGNLYQTSRMSGYSGGNNWTITADRFNQLSNQLYDTAGQVTSDQYGNSYAYNAEGRILSAGGGTYVYDGDGNRVKKTTATATTLYWPGAGSLLDESDSSGSAMAKQVQFAGLTVWSESIPSGGRFLFQDHLGSTRMTGDAAGSVKDDMDYLPFGSIVANYGASPSDNHYTFTGYESDQTENSTEYAMFRSLSTSMGRFNRPDPLDASYEVTNPQTLNRYIYTEDKPLAFIDPSGLMEATCSSIYGGSWNDYGIISSNCSFWGAWAVFSAQTQGSNYIDLIGASNTGIIQKLQNFQNACGNKYQAAIAVSDTLGYVGLAGTALNGAATLAGNGATNLAAHADSLTALGVSKLAPGVQTTAAVESVLETGAVLTTASSVLGTVAKVSGTVGAVATATSLGIRAGCALGWW